MMLRNSEKLQKTLTRQTFKKGKHVKIVSRSKLWKTWKNLDKQLCLGIEIQKQSKNIYAILQKTIEG